MLYTVSGVQILATLDAFDDLDRRIKDGRLKIGSCAWLLLACPLPLMLMKHSYSQLAGS